VKNLEKEIKNLAMPKKKTKKKKKIKKIIKKEKKNAAKKPLTQSNFKSDAAKKPLTQSNFKSNEEKVQIKKIKKQSTEKKIYNIKDYVVYPKHGVGKITSIDKATIGNIEINFYKVLIEKEKLTLSIPLNQQSHLRHVSSINQINKAIIILKSKPKIKRTMWSRRAQEYEQKINSGKIYELAEVVRDLNKKTDVIAEQSYSERQLFEKAYERLMSEFEVVLKEKAKIKIDKALKRNEGIEEKEILK
jgi:CarD family transcriptional regulator